jgi:hypothetical protein
VVVTLLTFAGTRFAKRQIDSDLRETAQITAIALADDIELRQEPWNAEALVPVLRDFMNAGTDLRSISVFRADRGTAVPVISTSVVAAVPDAVVLNVITTGEPAWSETTPHIALIVTPIHRDEVVTGAVAVAVSLAAVEQWQRTTGIMAVGGAGVAIVAITLVIHLLARRLILDPLAEIRRVTARTRVGDLGARARVTRTYEMWEVADAANAMLADLGSASTRSGSASRRRPRNAREQRGKIVRSCASVSQMRRGRAPQQLAAVRQTLAQRGASDWNPAESHLGPRAVAAPGDYRFRDAATPADRREQAERMASAVRVNLQLERREARCGAPTGSCRRSAGDHR